MNIVEMLKAEIVILRRELKALKKEKASKMSDLDGQLQHHRVLSALLISGWSVKLINDENCDYVEWVSLNGDTIISHDEFPSIPDEIWAIGFDIQKGFKS